MKSYIKEYEQVMLNVNEDDSLNVIFLHEFCGTENVYCICTHRYFIITALVPKVLLENIK